MFSSADDGGGQTPPFWKQRGWLLAAAFLAVAVIMSLVAVATGGGASRQQTSTARGPLSGPMAGTTGRPAGCDTDDRAGRTPTAPPRDVRWRTLGGTQVPLSRSAGPTRSNGPLLWCFAHTPMGAVMAAHVIPAQMTAPDWRTVAGQQIVAGFGRDLFVSQRGSLSQADVQTRRNGTYTGFLLSDYTGDSALVDLLIKSPDGRYFHTSVSMSWSGGDWKVKPGSDGGLHSELSSASGPNGYVRWEA
jgi:hypothetical protein